MKVPKEVISKAIMDAPDTHDIPSYIAQRAAEYGWNECMKLWADHMKRMNDAIKEQK